MMKSIRIKVDALRAINDPFKDYPWEDGGKLSRLKIRRRIDNFQFETRVHTKLRTPYALSTEYHLRRIAFLVCNGWDTPIQIDVGVPALGFSPEWLIQDGNHRFAAAIYRGDETILANWSGDVDVMQTLFEIDSALLI